MDQSYEVIDVYIGDETVIIYDAEDDQHVEMKDDYDDSELSDS